MKVSPFNAIFQKHVIDVLKTIDGVSVLDGYMVHHASELMTPGSTVSFPCVAAQPDDDEVNPNGSNDKGTITRKVTLIGAVSTVDRSKVNEEINNLIYTVRCAVAVDKYSLSDVSEIVLGKVKYDLPAGGESYAYFAMDLMITYVENWSQ